MGQIVGSGTYEVVVEIKTATGYEAYASQTITVLDGKGPSPLGQVKIMPNPVVEQDDVINPIRFAWDGTDPGEITIRTYNIAAELVAKLRAKVSDTFTDWNLTGVNGGKLASGFYVAVIEDKTDSGKLERRIMKLSIIRKL